VSDQSYSWTLTVPLPAGTADDPYDPDDLAGALRELADRVEREDLPPTGDLWDRAGRLLGRGQLVAPAGVE
jgi:hypothetical protein